MRKYNRPMLRRICKDCGNWFQPIGKFSRTCPACKARGVVVRMAKRRQKREMEVLNYEK